MCRSEISHLGRPSEGWSCLSPLGPIQVLQYSPIPHRDFLKPVKAATGGEGELRLSDNEALIGWYRSTDAAAAQGHRVPRSSLSATSGGRLKTMVPSTLPPRGSHSPSKSATLMARQAACTHQRRKLGRVAHVAAPAALADAACRARHSRSLIRALAMGSSTMSGAVGSTAVCDSNV